MSAIISSNVGIAHGLPLSYPTRFKSKTRLTTQHAGEVRYHFGVAKILKQSGLISIEWSVSDANVFSAQFTLTREYQQHFALLKGFFSFGKTGDFNIALQKHSNAFIVTVPRHSDGKAVQYFLQVFSMLRQEISYRKLLRTILYKEKQWQTEMRGLYSITF